MRVRMPEDLADTTNKKKQRIAKYYRFVARRWLTMAAGLAVSSPRNM